LRRQLFLETFLKALGAQNILWGKIDDEKIYGTVIYDEADFEERQDFVWKMREENVPSKNAEKLLNALRENNLISVDKIVKSVAELSSAFLSEEEKQLALEEISKVSVMMIDDGIESDTYFLHH